MEGNVQETELGNKITVYQGDPTTEAQDAKKTQMEAVRKFVEESLDRWAASDEADKPQRKRSLEEVEFNSGKHWDADMQKEREDKDRVVIQINRTPQYLNQVSNEQRMSRPTILVKPTGHKSDPKTAGVKQGMVRSIEKRSGAEGIRDDAFYRMLEKGWAYYRVTPEFEHARSFRQVIRTKPIENDFAVYGDPGALRKDKLDSKWWHILEDMPIAEYKAAYPNSQMASMTGQVSLGDEVKEWVDYKKGVIRVAEYMYMVREPMLLYALPSKNPASPYDYDGKFEDELTPEDRVSLVKDKATGKPLIRHSVREKPYWCKINAVEVLEGNDDLTAGRPLLGKYMGIVPIVGRKVLVNGKYLYTGMVRDAMEPCLASDYWLSAITEMVALAPKSPWVAASKAIDNYREMWLDANVENQAVLVWDHEDESGKPIPQPFRNFGEPPIQAMTFILRFADEDLKRVMGIYSAGLGAPGPETSGIAIRNRQKESDVANYNYVDNLKESISLEARYYLDLIPHVYDQEQVVEIVRPEGEAETKAINIEFKADDGTMVKYDMEAECDAEVEVGPSFDTQRQESAASMAEYLKMDPGAAPFIGDLIARNQDFPDSDLFEARLKHRVPPEALDDKGDNSQVPPKFMAQYKQNAQTLEQTTELLKQLQAEKDKRTDQYEHEKEMKAMELASQERRAELDNQVKLAAITSKSDMDEFKLIVGDILREFKAFQKDGTVETTSTGTSAQAAVPPAQQPAVEQPAPNAGEAA